MSVLLRGDSAEAVARRADLAYLLEIGSRLSQATEHDSALGPLAVVGGRIGTAACRLVGIEVADEGEEPADMSVLRIAIERPTDKLWNVELEAFGDKAVVHYLDGVSRREALAIAFVMLARTMLDVEIRPEPDQSPEERDRMLDLESKLAALMDEYEDGLCQKPEPEPSFVGGSVE